MATTSRETSDAQDREHARRQHEAAKRHNEALRQQEKENEDAGLHVSTKLTTKEHVGKVAEEPHKDDEMAALGQDQKARTGVDKVRTVPQKTEGKGTTDEVVVEPQTAAGRGHTALPKGEAEKVFEAAKGKGKTKAKGKK